MSASSMFMEGDTEEWGAIASETWSKLNGRYEISSKGNLRRIGEGDHDSHLRARTIFLIDECPDRAAPEQASHNLLAEVSVISLDGEAMSRPEREGQLARHYESVGACSSYQAKPMREDDKRRNKGRWVYRVDPQTRKVIGRSKMRISEAAARFGLTPQGIHNAATHGFRSGEWMWRFACEPKGGRSPRAEQPVITEAA
jgi:hypothetical protein